VKQKNIIHSLLLASLCMTCLSCGQTGETDTTAVAAEAAKTVNEPVKPAQQVSVDKNKIAGTWVRTDAPYNLKITDVSSDGNMKVEYLNPKPIHVGKATWSTDVNAAINIYVELRDENYPGSNYTLVYMPDKDLLAGKYFQAVEGATYDVEFTRVK
jgi:hypothetical protein